MARTAEVGEFSIQLHNDVTAHLKVVIEKKAVLKSLYHEGLHHDKGTFRAKPRVTVVHRCSVSL